VMVPPYSAEGHYFFADVDGWSSIVEGFLQEKGLLPLPDPTPKASAGAPEASPPGLGPKGIADFQVFLAHGPMKAFATNGRGGWGWSFGKPDQEAADQRALENCTNSNKGVGVCKIVSRGEQQ
jgi:hypothetical protein